MKNFKVTLELEESVEAATAEEAQARFKDNFEFADIHHGTFRVEEKPDQNKKKFEVIRHYTCSAVYEVEADDEEHAYKLACQGEGHRKTYDGTEDDNYEVMEILVEGV